VPCCGLLQHPYCSSYAIIFERLHEWLLWT
jgi:hypothetical protein